MRRVQCSRSWTWPGHICLGWRRVVRPAPSRPRQRCYRQSGLHCWCRRTEHRWTRSRWEENAAARRCWATVLHKRFALGHWSWDGLVHRRTVAVCDGQRAWMCVHLVRSWIWSLFRLQQLESPILLLSQLLQKLLIWGGGMRAPCRRRLRWLVAGWHRLLLCHPEGGRGLHHWARIRSSLAKKAVPGAQRVAQSSCVG